MDFARRLKKMRQQADLTQAELAEKVGLTNRAIGAWESGKARPRLDKLEEVAQVLGTTSSSLLHGDKPLVGAAPIKGTSAMVPMRVLGKTHAGDPLEEIEDLSFVEVPETVANNHPSAFMLRVEGGCMNRSYPDGCLVMVDPAMSPWNGCAVVAEPSSGESVLRRYYRGQSSLLLTADSYDSYDDLVFTGDDEVRLLGVVVWFQASREESK